MIIKRTKIGTTPVTVEEARQHLRLMDDTFDPLLATLIEAAVDHAENITGLVLRDGSEYTVATDYATTVRTGIAPVKTVSGKADDSNISITMTDGSIIYLNEDKQAESVTLEIVTGFDRFPDGIRAAILLIVGKLFANPNDGVENLPSAATNLLKNYRIWDR